MEPLSGKSCPAALYRVSGDAQSVAFSPNGKWLAIDFGNRVQLVDLTSKRRTTMRIRGGARTLTTTSTGISLVCVRQANGRSQGVIAAWTKFGNPHLNTRALAAAHTPISSGISNDGKTAFFRSQTELELWSRRSHESRLIQCKFERGEGLAFTSDGLARWGGGLTVYPWIGGAKTEVSAHLPISKKGHYIFFPDSRYTVWGSVDNRLYRLSFGSLEIMDLRSLAESRLRLSSAVQTLSLDANTKFGASITSERANGLPSPQVTVFEVKTGEVKVCISGEDRWPNCVAIDREGRTVAVASNGRLALYRI